MSPVSRSVIAAINLYRRLPRMRPPVCRFDPSCSSYAAQAVEVHGALHGGWLAAKRVGKCHPWGPAGWDPVPGTEDPVSATGCSRVDFTTADLTAEPELAMSPHRKVG